MRAQPSRWQELIPIENEDGSVTATLATDLPATEGGKGEALRSVVWDLESADLSRGTYGLGLYAEHDYRAETLGVVDNLRVVAGAPTRLLGDLKFRSSARAQEYKRDVLSGTVRGVSAGVRYHNATYKRTPNPAGGADLYTVRGIEPFECSLTNIPEDIRSGFGATRAINQEDFDIPEEETRMAKKSAPAIPTEIVEEKIETPEKAPEAPAPEKAPEVTPAPEIAPEPAPVLSPMDEKIAAIKGHRSAEEEATDLIVDAVATTTELPITEISQGETRMINPDAPLSTVLRTDADNHYNFSNALRSLAFGSTLAGAEAEFQQEAERKYGRVSGNAQYLNVAALAGRTSTTLTTDGASASADMSSGILTTPGGSFGMLFPASVFNALGVKVRQATGPVQVAYMVGAPTVSGRAENDASGTAATALTYTDRTIKMVTATAKVIATQDSLTDTNLINLEADIKNALTEQVRVHVEASAFGYSSTPSATQNTYGIFQAGTKVKWASGADADDFGLTTTVGLTKLDELTSTIEDFNVSTGDVKYFVTPSNFNSLKYLPWMGSDGHKMLLTNGVLAENAPVVKVSKDILGVGPSSVADHDADATLGSSITSTIVACKQNALTLYELAAPLMKMVEDENLVSKGLVCFHISYRYAVVLDRPEYATYLNVKL